LKILTIIERRLKELSSAADGFEIELAGTLRADQRAFRRADDDVAGNSLRWTSPLTLSKVMSPNDLLDIDQARLGFQLQFGFFGHGELEVRFKFQGWGGEVQNTGSERRCGHRLLHLKANLVGELAGEMSTWAFLEDFNFDAAIGDVVNHDHGPALHGKMLFEMTPGSARGDTPEQRKLQRRRPAGCCAQCFEDAC